MNALERVLQNDLDRLVDRLAATTRAGVHDECSERRPEVAARLHRVDERLAAARLELLRGYAEWCDALEECGDAWAVAELSADQVSEPGLRAA
jgi:hypothetical protein